MPDFSLAVSFSSIATWAMHPLARHCKSSRRPKSSSSILNPLPRAGARQRRDHAHEPGFAIGGVEHDDDQRQIWPVAVDDAEHDGALLGRRAGGRFAARLPVPVLGPDDALCEAPARRDVKQRGDRQKQAEEYAAVRSTSPRTALSGPLARIATALWLSRSTPIASMEKGRGMGRRSATLPSRGGTLVSVVKFLPILSWPKSSKSTQPS